MLACREAEPLYPEPSLWGLTISGLNTTWPSQDPVGLQEDQEDQAELSNMKQSWSTTMAKNTGLDKNNRGDHRQTLQHN